MRAGVVDISQQIDRMTTKNAECPCLTPCGEPFLMKEKRLMTGRGLRCQTWILNTGSARD